MNFSDEIRNIKKYEKLLRIPLHSSRFTADGIMLHANITAQFQERRAEGKRWNGGRTRRRETVVRSTIVKLGIICNKTSA
ncbi:hypothetical protein Tcan_11541 [Toxocara canis]|uniref:Uncharacterized protein n=1 Tax=Toxocara canis TaxID=6265 RepID=A0A0B2UVE9_TOXCA|nr:hypothetical protein Tcan_11541 [Toxocara canis]